MAETISVHLVLRDPGHFKTVAERCRHLNLSVMSRREGETVAVSGDRTVIERLLTRPVEITHRRTFLGRGLLTVSDYAAAEGTTLSGASDLGPLVSELVFPVRPHYWQPHAFPPHVPYYHLHVPQDISRLLGVQQAHAAGITGQGVRVAMIDTGFYPHPYYTTRIIHGGRALNISTHGVLGKPASDPDADEYGHGTGIASNVLAIAPGCEFHHIKEDGDPVAAFDIARSLEPQVITCSWGWGEDYVNEQFTNAPNSNAARYLRLLEQTIQAAIDAGVVVLFASGNGPLPGSWPSSMRDVISVGGAFIDQGGELLASSYATSFISQVYGNRLCPDVCGLVGPAPHGLLIMMPTQPDNELDGEFSAVDGTQVGDGWLVASGTSSATPQVAGMVALLQQLNGGMTPAEVKATLQEMAVGVTQGRSGSGHMASSQRPNLATGYGLVTLRRPNRAAGYTLL